MCTTAFITAADLLLTMTTALRQNQLAQALKRVDPRQHPGAVCGAPYVESISAWSSVSVSSARAATTALRSASIVPLTIGIDAIDGPSRSQPEFMGMPRG